MLRLLDAATENLESNFTSPTRLAFWRGCCGDLIDLSAPNCIAVIEFARWATSDRAPDVIADTGKSPSEYFADMIKDRVSSAALPGNPLFDAVSHVALAFLKYKAHDYQAAYADLARAAEGYDRTWRLTELRIGQSPETPLDPATAGFDLSNSDQANEILRVADQCGFFGADGIRRSTYLVLRRLLHYLLGQDEDEILFPNRLNVLFAKGSSDGVVLPADFQLEESAISGTYLDPLAFGVTLIEKRMCDSIRLAWRCCSGISLRNKAIRISANLPFSVDRLRGDSAGALFAAGMIVTAKSVALDQNRTATCALRLDESRLSEDEQNPIQPTDLQFDSVGSLTQKIDETWYGQHGIDQVLLCAEDHLSWQNQNANWQGLPEVQPVTSLHDLIQRLTTNRQYDRILGRHARAVFQEWDQTAKDACDPLALSLIHI